MLLKITKEKVISIKGLSYFHGVIELHKQNAERAIGRN